MTIEEIILHIDAEINRLTEARDLVAGTAVGKVSRSPRKSGLAAPKPSAVRAKRVISPEGRARIAAAQKLRWAKQKRAKDKALGERPLAPPLRAQQISRCSRQHHAPSRRISRAQSVAARTICREIP